MKKETYKCECCGGTFNKGWTDEEAIAEFKAKFPDTDMSATAIVCDDCNKLVEKWLKERTLN